MVLTRLFILIAFIFSGILILYPADYALGLGMTILFMATLIYAGLSKDETARARWIFFAVFLLLMGLITWRVNMALETNRQPIDIVSQLGIRVISLVAGAIISVFLTTIFFLITVYVSAIYVLSIQQVEGISVWQAFRSLMSLILKINYDWIVISEGKISKVKEKGVMKELGGPGKVIVDPGNAVALQRGGKITQIKGAGVWMTKRNENIREIFDLTNQFVQQSVKNVMTADRIPLDVEMGIGYRIVREENSNVEGLIDTRDDSGGFPVKKETLMKAIFNNTTGGKWAGFGGGAPTGQLRDHFMTFTLEELFELAPDDEATLRPNRRRIGQIEQTIKDTLNGFAANNGVTITVVDIREVKIPKEMMDAMMLEIKSGAEARSIRQISQQRNLAQQNLISGILNTIASVTGRPIGDVELQMATEFVRMSKRELTDDVLGHEYIQMLHELAKGDGTKVFTPPNLGVELKDIV